MNNKFKPINPIITALACLLIVGLQVACVKKEIKNPPVYPKIYPRSYLPAYPGSYWVYEFDKGGSGTYTINTGPDYVHDSVNTVSFSTPNYYHAMVPVYNGQNLWGVKTHYYIHAQNNGLSWMVFLKDSATFRGETWGGYYYRGSPAKNYVVTIAADTSLSINGKIYQHVIVTRSYTRVYGSSIILGSDSYYAKDVGMIATYGYNNKFFRSMEPTDYMPADSVISSMKLKEYFINKK